MSDSWTKIIAALAAGTLIALQAGNHVRLNDVADEVYPKDALVERHEAHDMWRQEMEARVQHIEQQQMVDARINERVMQEHSGE